MTVERHEFDVGPAAMVDVQVKAGSVNVRNGAAGQVVVEVDAADVDDWHIGQSGDVVSVEPPRSRLWSRSARVHVDVPAGTDVDVRAASADVTLAGSFGATRVKVASGDVAAGAVGRLEVSTASGDVRIDDAASDAMCTSASGAVGVGAVAGRIVVTTASGDVRIGRAADDVQISTATGDVRVDRYDGSDITVKTTTGRVAVGLPAGIRVEPDLSTLSGRTRLPAPASASADAGVRRRVRVRLRTISGDIDITRV